MLRADAVAFLTCLIILQAVAGLHNFVYPCNVPSLCHQFTSYSFIDEELSVLVLKKDSEVEERPMMFCLVLSPLSKITDTDNAQYICSREILETSLQWMVRARRRWRGLWLIQVVGHGRTGELVYESQPQTHLFQWIPSHSEHGVIHGELGQVIAQPLVSETQGEVNEENAQEWLGMLVTGLDVAVNMLVDKTQQLGDMMVLNLQSPPRFLPCQSTRPSLILGQLTTGTIFMQIIGKRVVWWLPPNINQEQVKDLSLNEKLLFLQSHGTKETQLSFPENIYIERIFSNDEIKSSRLFVHKITDNYTVLKPFGPNNYQTLLTSIKHHAQLTNKVTVKAKANANSSCDRKKLARVCMWSGSTMDGQRTIWLQMLRSLDPNHQKYTFSMIIGDTSITMGSSIHLLHDPLAGDSFSDTQNDLKSNLTIFHALYQIQSTIGPLLQVGRSPLDLFPFESSVFDESPSYQDTEHYLGSLMDFIKFQNHSTVTIYLLTEYAHRRFVAANGVMSRIEPSWVCRLYRMLARALRRPNKYPIELNSADPLNASRYGNGDSREAEDDTVEEGVSCDMLLLSNGKGLTTDVLITDAARSISLPVLLELPNLYMHPSLTTSVVVAPSHYSLRHPSMRAALQLESEQTKEVQGVVAMVRGSIAADYDVSVKPRPVSVVIAPSVDTKHFRSQRHHNKMQSEEREAWNNYRHGYADDKEVEQENDDDDDGAVRIGFIGRLVEAKSPGLFLLAAKVLYECMPQVRFVIVGSGQLLSYLKELSVRLQLEGVVQWVPWVQYNDLPQVLDQLDIVFNPSLETFCIANIECMSMGIPLVTFAVGGIGEYFSDEPLSRLEPVDDKNQYITDMDRDRMIDVVVDGPYGKRLLLIDGDTEVEAKIKTNPIQLNVHATKEQEHTGNSKSGYSTDNSTWTVTRTGILLHVATPTDIAEALQYLAERPMLRTALGRAARTVVETRFATDRQMSQYEQLFDSVYSTHYC